MRSEIELREVEDFGEFVNNPTFLIDWQNLEDNYFFQVLKDTLNFDNNGRELALEAIADWIYRGKSLVEIFGDNQSVQNFFDKLKDDIPAFLLYKSNILDENIFEVLEKRGTFFLNSQDVIDKLKIDKNSNVGDEKLLLKYFDYSEANFKKNFAKGEYSYKDYESFKENILALRESVLDHYFGDGANTINHIWNNLPLVFKKGWFKENGREAFFNDLKERIYAISDFEAFYNSTDFGNLNDKLTQARNLLRLSSEDLVELYDNHLELMELDYEEPLEISKKGKELETLKKEEVVVDVICYFAEKCFDSEYNQQELEFYKAETRTDLEQEDAEAHGEFDDIRSTDLDKPNGSKNRKPKKG